MHDLFEQNYAGRNPARVSKQRWLLLSFLYHWDSFLLSLLNLRFRLKRKGYPEFLAILTITFAANCPGIDQIFQK
jgi:hypothetical protein